MYRVEGSAGPLVIWGEVVGIWEDFYSPVIMSQSLSEPLPLDWELLKCFSFLLPTLLGGTGCLDWAGVGFSHNWAGSAMPCLRSFSWGQVLRSTECSGIFRMVPSPVRLQEAGGDFSVLFTVGTWSSSCRHIPEYCGGCTMAGCPFTSYSAGFPGQHWLL